MKRTIIMGIMLVVMVFGQANLKAGGEIRLSPRLLNYQGFLTDTLGYPITNPAVSITLGIWTSSSGGSQLWFETQPISVTKGIFNVILGNISPIPDSVFTKGTDRWLELTYAGITLSPRTRITAAGYALSSAYADTAFSVVNNAITTPKILDTAVTMAKIARTGATTNQVIKWNGSMWQPSTDVASSDTDWIFSGNNIYSGVSGNVGIGTANPAYMLNVGNWTTANGSGTGQGVISAEGNEAYIGWGDRSQQSTNRSKSWGWYATGGKTYLWDNLAGANRITVDGSSGNLGLGATDPIARLDINGGAIFRRGDGDTTWRWSIYNNAVSSVGDFGLTFQKSGPGPYLVLGNSNNNSYFPIGRVGILTANPVAAFAVSTGDDRKQFVINPYVDAYTVGIGIPDWYSVGQLTFINGSERMRIDNNGNVGIGTATPQVPLDVVGYVRTNGNDDVGGCFSIFNASKMGAIVNNWTIFNMTGAYGNALKFWRYYQNGTNAGPSLTLYDNGDAYLLGNVGIGQAFPSYKLDVAGTTRTNGLVIPTGASTGYVLTSNASGIATWQAPTLVSHNHIGQIWSSTSATLGLEIDYDVNTTSSVDGYYADVSNSNNGWATGGTFNAGGTGQGLKYGADCFASSPVGNIWEAVGIRGIGDNAGSGYASGGRFHGRGTGAGTKYGIYCSVSGSGALYAGYFDGDVRIIGTLSKGSGSFLIDHPLDPQNKTLRHNFVESPENLCLYRGKVKLNTSGEGKVEMPNYFKALTKETEATVTLTSIGRPFNVGYDWNGDYTIFTVYGEPNREVSYVVMADRDDPVMRQLYKPVEEEKGNGNFTKGKLLYPKAYGYPDEMGENYEMQQEAAHADAGGKTGK